MNTQATLFYRAALALLFFHVPAQAMKEILNGGLWRALENNNSSNMKDWIFRGADVNTQNKQGITPLMRAANKGNEEIVKLLLKEGADLYLQCKKNCSAIQHASSGQGKNCCDLLVEAMLNQGITAEQKKRVYSFFICVKRNYPKEYPHLLNVFKEPLRSMIKEEHKRRARQEVNKIALLPIKSELIKKHHL